MFLAHLSLENFRNFVELELDLAPGVTVLYGGNAQGKTNLLEAVSMLATAKSLRAGSERELIRWDSLEQDEIPFARVKAVVRRKRGEVLLDIVTQVAHISGAGRALGKEPFALPLDDSTQLQKRVRINGVSKRPGDLVGEANAVLFSPQDIELVHGSPSVRRRYLDVMLSQADRTLLSALQKYTRVLAQRNSLLKAVREHVANANELSFWDEQLVESGAVILSARLAAMSSLEGLARSIHGELTGSEEELALTYEPSVRANAGQDLRIAFSAALDAMREREVLLGVSLVGPHRDDFVFSMGGRPMAVYASRGQQRTASLALKLAEARYLEERAGDKPILLLDDVFSELDGRRRVYLLTWVRGWEQALLTTAEPERIGPGLLPAARMLEVKAGRIVE